jgi:hypothetical protein
MPVGKEYTEQSIFVNKNKKTNITIRIHESATVPHYPPQILYGLPTD